MNLNKFHYIAIHIFSTLRCVPTDYIIGADLRLVSVIDNSLTLLKKSFKNNHYCYIYHSSVSYCLTAKLL